MAASSNLESIGGTPEASEFGGSLRDMRVAHDTDISTVASTLRIRQVYLQAIEDGRFDDLPGPTYAAGFVRAYAEYLGLDIAETMQRYRDATGNTGAQAPLVAPSPVVEGRMPTGFILLVAAVLAATAYGSWYYLSLHGRDAGDLVAKLPQQIADMVGLSSEEPPVPPSSVPSAEPSQNNQASEPSAAVTEVAAQKAAAEEPAAAGPAMVQAAAPPPASIETLSGNVASAVQETAAAPIVENASELPAALSNNSLPAGSENNGADVVAVAAASALSTSPPPATEVAAVTPVSVTPVSATPAAIPASPVATVTDISGQADVPVSAERTDAVRISTLPAQQQAALPEAPTATPALTVSRVVLRATAISWVELRDAAGKRVFSRLLKKGETYNVPAQPGITLATGNAGALDILVDGQTISPIGPPGAVRRDVLLEPKSLLERSAGAR